MLRPSNEMALRPELTGPDPPLAEARRLRHAFEAHFDYVWRLLRRLGVQDALVDDEVQRVFLVLSRKLDSIAAGKEQAYLTTTAVRVASNHRRSTRRRLEVLDEERIHAAVDPTLGPEERLQVQRKLALLDHILEQLPMQLRSVLVLFEIEDRSTAEVAELLDVPIGTVASRLRRAREQFLELARALDTDGPDRRDT
jgi:RNA polymerase sigma-70 factor (ECF subfamily)